MSDKLTDSQIVKALELYRKDIGCAKCDYEDEDLLVVISNALDLINRLQAENERLKNTVGTLTNNAVDFANEIARHKKDKEDAFIMAGQIIDAEKTVIAEAKAEAYKECIEKVKSELRNIAKIDWQDNYYYLVGIAFFDNILKELGVVVNDNKPKM